MTAPVFMRRIAGIIPATLVLAALSVAGSASPASAATPPTLSLRILLIGEGSTDPTTAAWESALSSEGVPYTLATSVGAAPTRTVSLPALSSGNRGNFNGVVIADSPTDYAAGALSALDSYESTFGVRQIDGYMFPLPALGVTDVTSGPLDGTTATLTAAGIAAFPELRGPVPLDTGTFGYGATVNSGAPYTSFLTDTAGHTMAGVFQHPSGDPQAGVSELALLFNYNANSLQWLLLGAGLINWVTQNTHLGLYRNYFGQDIDDNFIADNEWSSLYQCTPAATEPPDFTCPTGVANNPLDSPPDVLMSAADVAHVVAWQQQTGIKLTMAFNAVGACTAPTVAQESNAVCTGGVTEGGATYTDPGQVVDAGAANASGLVNAFLANQGQFQWVNHTWSHQFLGCVVWQPQGLTSVNSNSSGGTLSGSYDYEVTAATAYGESEPSLPKSTTVSAGSVTVAWPEATNGAGTDGTPGPTLAAEQASRTGGTGFWGYNIYRAPHGSTAFGLVGQVAENPSATTSTTYTFTDAGAAAGAAPDSSSTFPTATNPGIDCASADGSWEPATSTTADASIAQEIALDQAFGKANGLTNYDPSLVVTGEHSGIDNPNFGAALAAVGVTTFASDASRQPQEYTIGAASAAPRYPSNIYYNASTWADELNEYNTLYVARGVGMPGGTGGETGHCENTSATTCISTPATEATLLASESHIMLSHVLANNPRVGYAHQSNLIGPDYTILTLIDNMLGQYNTWFTDPVTPVTDVSEVAALTRQAAWAKTNSAATVTATETNGVVTIANSGTAVDIPVTVPAGTTVNGSAFGQAYGGQRSDWVSVGTAPLVLTENVVPTINSGAAASSIVGAAFSYTVSTTGAPTPAITESGALPSGLGFTDNGNGTATISGTPVTGSGGSYPITISASNGVGSAATQSFVLTNAEAPTITSASATTFVVGIPNTYTVTTTGYPAATITESGALPPGLTFTANTNGTAAISGSASGTAGNTVVTISASNISGSVSTLSLTITVNVAAPPKITSAGNAFFTLGQGGAIAVTTTGAPVPVITETGALPQGLTFVDNHNGTALVSGNPSATGTTPITVTASNGLSPDAVQTLTFIVGQAPAFTSPSSATFTAGTASTFSVTTSGYPAPSIGQTGLPVDLSFVDKGDGTALISGTPAAADVGPHAVTVTAVNGTGRIQQTLTFTVVAAPAAPAITSAATATFAASQAGSFTVTTTGSPPPVLTEAGALPPGVTFVNNANGTATLAGTPAAGTQGSYPVTITASNGITPNAIQQFTLTVNSGLAITSAASATAIGGTAFSFTVTTAGTPTPTLTRAGTLPTGVSFTANANGTATLAGTPAATATGLYPLTFTATNSTGTASQGFTLTISQKPVFISAATATETAGTAFSLAVVATGFPAPAVAESGTLPPGVSFTPSSTGTATITGTSTVAAGAYQFALTASNAGGIASQTFVLTVKAKAAGTVPAFTSPAAVTATIGKLLAFTVTTAATPAVTTNITLVGTLPAGVSFSNNGDGTADLTDTPAANSGGIYPLTFTAKNSAGSTTQSFVLTVTGPPTITSAAAVSATVGSSFNFTVRTTGAPTPKITESGTLPSGISFVDNANGTATLAGTPTSTSGTFALRITATNTGGTATQTLTLTVTRAPAITSPASATATLRTALTFTFTAIGFPLPNVTRTGTLPRGLSFTNNGDGTATLTGTPTVAGTYNLTITATNAVGTATQAFTITVR